MRFYFDPCYDSIDFEVTHGYYTFTIQHPDMKWQFIGHDIDIIIGPIQVPDLLLLLVGAPPAAEII